MSDIIQLLPDNVANQIAAGEVVQRPASVVKELLENSVDAGAKSIQLIVKDAGRSLIQVIDDGIGMSQTDARLSFERHATSKIKSAKDLYNLHTNGFRGEALASIAAISYVTLKTKKEDAELGTHIELKGGEVISQEMISKSTGTNVEVKNLFYNIPARRNFLKSNTVETRHIIDAFQRVALTYPNISFSLVHNNSEIFILPSGKSHSESGSLKQRLVNIFGKKIDEKLVPINEETEILRISGYVVKPNNAKKKRGEQFFFVNGRFIKSPYLHHAVLSAFEELIPHGYHPSYFLYLKVPPESIDINIHPTKTEIKFDNERDLYAIIRSTIKHSLGQYNISPALDFSKNPNFETPYHYKNKSVGTPNIEVDSSFNPFEKEKSTQSFYKRKDLKSSWEALYSDIDKNENGDAIDLNRDDSSINLFSKDEDAIGTSFQVHKRYILSSIKSGIVLIDQNAAHQRILYEEYLAKITVEGIGSQQLLFPKEISFSENDLKIISDLKGDLEISGIKLEISDEELKIHSIPTFLAEDEIIPLFDTILQNSKEDIPNADFSQIDSISKSMAKSMAIKKGTKLSLKEQDEIVNKLFLCKEPNFSPFGKKTYITISFDELGDMFNL